MKKFIVLLALTGFISCNKENIKSCDSCAVQGETIEICDNGDGTYTLTGGGESETFTQQELDEAGLTPKEVVELTCALVNEEL
jgi:hypothetical protein